uniref:Uncharacterized protein n=1 Tax=Rhizophora mucronata TaxID=61149 RepID=A0A2P2IZK1_RHIMU
MLHKLEISDSYLLEQRYNKERREDWAKISHISVVKIFSKPNLPRMLR